MPFAFCHDSLRRVFLRSRGIVPRIARRGVESRRPLLIARSPPLPSRALRGLSLIAGAVGAATSGLVPRLLGNDRPDDEGEEHMALSQLAA
ncbi:hypothetical protein E1292_30495 [Nonomuraea deserti]|uniref:Uncharacterized protein n=1 Tax=Nonomuraea deserti TaxID=1848322 RepID=A0A4V2Y9H2_9ACTN|nr:hypothetical protein [Nonomuraea deserti]TDC99885.1 hypothetical protein E1292_30495 [Nonomuraea deserti]